MPKIKSSLSVTSDEFKANAAAMQALVADLAAKRAEAASGGPDKLKERHVARGKLLPRDRVLRLIDPGSPLLELSPMAAEASVWRRSAAGIGRPRSRSLQPCHSVVIRP